MHFKIPRARFTLQILVLGFLAISTLSTYWQVRNFDFINFDDPKYIINNPMVGKGITYDSIRWAFSSLGYASNWHPLTWLSHMMDVDLYGLRPGMHHLTNVYLHIANAMLLFIVLNRMTRELWKSFAVAMLFALHPLHVESVAWVSERKDVLSTLFMMLTIGSYLWFVENRTLKMYLCMITCYALGLMAKPMLVTLPFVLLLLDFWPIKRPEFVRSMGNISTAGMKNTLADIQWEGALPLIREKIPLFVLAGISSGITIIAQKTGGATDSQGIISVCIRFANMVINYIAYLWKMLWPVNLSVYYPYPQILSPFMAIGASLLLILMTLFVLMAAKRLPFLTVGWLWYLGTLVPVIGIIQVGSQSMADRYMYVPLIGIFVMLAWGIPYLIERWQLGRYFAASLIIAIIPILIWTTRTQVAYWKDSIKLYSHALNVTKGNYLAHNNLAAALLNAGDVQGAIYHSNEALKILPNSMLAHYNLGRGFIRQHRYKEAIDHFKQAIQIDSNYADAHYNLGVALVGLGKIDEAITEFNEILRLNPQDSEAYKSIETARAKQREVDGQISRMNASLIIEPNNYTFHYKLGELYRKKGNTKQAIAHYDSALSIKPDFTQALNALAILYSEEGKYNEALLSLRKIVGLNPNDPEVYYNIACVYSMQGKVEEAIQHLNQAIQKGFKDNELLKTDPDLENIRDTSFYKNIIGAGLKP